jgi:medium-chain acyl-[acyl-carrier-protein] hydrolase
MESLCLTRKTPAPLLGDTTRLKPSPMVDHSHSVIRPRKRSAAALRLFCFPHAGVGTSVFRGWADDLPNDVEVCLIQLPGREGRLRENLFFSIQPLAEQLVAEFRELLDRPFFLYGHSLGATIAFEVARSLRRNNLPQPSHLFVGASPAPQLPWRHDLLRDLAEAEFIHALEARYAEMPKVVMDDPQMRALLVPVLRADVTMVETYQYVPEPPLACPITAYGGTQDRAVMQSELEAWKEQTAKEFRLAMLDGDHFFLQGQKAALLNSLKIALAVEIHALQRPERR